MLKSIAIIKHISDNGKYLFRVPKGVNLSSGGKIVCDTTRGTDPQDDF